MQAYFAMSWDPNDECASAHAKQIKSRISTLMKHKNPDSNFDGFVLYDLSDSEQDFQLAIRSGSKVVGAVFGSLFRTAQLGRSLPRASNISDEEVSRLQSSLGGTVISDFWGSYVLFLRVESTLVAITDPMSSVPCYYASEEGVTFLFSHLEKCWFLNKSRYSINYPFVAMMLAYDKVQTGETGLNGVKELPAGHRLRICGREQTIDCVWDPRSYACDALAGSVDDMVEVLRDTTTSVVRSWQSIFDRVSINVSGGLDSSIVLACLKDCTEPSELTAFHHLSNSRDPSEWNYAELAAKHVGSSLIPVSFDANEEIRGLEQHPLTTRPHRMFAGHNLLTAVGDQEFRLGDAIFTGQGGDHLFLHTSSPLLFADYALATNRAENKWLGELISAARLSQQSIWSVLKQTVPYCFGRKPRSPIVDRIKSRSTAVTHEIVEAADFVTHLPDWVKKPSGLPPEKFNQVCGLYHLVHVRESLDWNGRRDIIHPLASQPLIELCLNIPTYILCAGGRSRGLARMAFKGAIPDEICNRMTKGDTSHHFIDFIRSNKAKIGDALLNGQLEAHGLISRDDIYRFLHQDQFVFETFGRMVLTYYAVEAWLHVWNAELNSMQKFALYA